jgi:DNA mismatch endonuclease (patch repair protein)
MVDNLTPEARSAMMSKIKGKNTKPELLLRRALHKLGLRYRLHRRISNARPDLVFPTRQIAVFVHGCFWHQHQDCKHFRLPRSNIEFWQEKLSRNSVRDARNVRSLRDAGWRIAIIWERAITPKTITTLSQHFAAWLDGDKPYFIASDVGGSRAAEVGNQLELPWRGIDGN